MQDPIISGGPTGSQLAVSSVSDSVADNVVTYRRILAIIPSRSCIAEDAGSAVPGP